MYSINESEAKRFWDVLPRGIPSIDAALVETFHAPFHRRWAGAVDAEDLIHMLHPPGMQLLLARLKQRQKAQAQQAKEEHSEQLLRDVLRIPTHGMKRSGRK